MAITLTKLKGSDSVPASRPIIIDNFNLIEDEINALETYLDPDAATLEGMNAVDTLELTVGATGAALLEITTTAFTVNSSVTFSGASSLINIKGLLAQDSFSLIDQAVVTSPLDIDPVTGYGTYTVKHTNTGADLVLQLQDGNPGQEVCFVLEQYAGTSNVELQAEGTSTFVLDSSNTKIQFDGVGSTVTMKFVTDSANNGAWYVVGQHNVTYAS